MRVMLFTKKSTKQSGSLRLQSRRLVQHWQNTLRTRLPAKSPGMCTAKLCSAQYSNGYCVSLSVTILQNIPCGWSKNTTLARRDVCARANKRLNIQLVRESLIQKVSSVRGNTKRYHGQYYSLIPSSRCLVWRRDKPGIQIEMIFTELPSPTPLTSIYQR